jgi:hypothetical protein
MTTRQQSELNDYIARRDNQWAERQDESRYQAEMEKVKAKDKASDDGAVETKKDAASAPREQAAVEGTRGLTKKESLLKEPASQGALQPALQQQLQKLEARAGGAETDEPRWVLIVVPEQAINLPTGLSAAATTQPAAAKPAQGKN